jgi:hypothetical protein
MQFKKIFSICGWLNPQIQDLQTQRPSVNRLSRKLRSSDRKKRLLGMRTGSDMGRPCGKP